MVAANLGFTANMEPVVSSIDAITHVDLPIAIDLTNIATDAEGDALLYRLTNAQNGLATLGRDGKFVQFIPNPGFSGPASFQIQAIDGVGLSIPGTVTIDVSDAPLIELDFVERQPQSLPGETFSLQMIGDFADEESVVLPASYLNFTSSDPNTAFVTSAGRVTSRDLGTSILQGSSHGIQATTVLSVALPDFPSGDLSDPIEIDVAPGAITLEANVGQRQLRVIEGETDITSHVNTRYFVSNSSVIDVSANGLVTALSQGTAKITVIHETGEFVVPVRVAVPLLGPIDLSSTGGIVTTTDGSVITIPPESIDEPFPVNLTSLPETAMPFDLPDGFAFAGGFQLDVGHGELEHPLQLQVPVSNEFPVGDAVYFFRADSVPDVSGATQNVWFQLDSGIIEPGGFVRTNSDFLPGSTRSGTYFVGHAPPTSLGTVRGALFPVFPDEEGTFVIVAHSGTGIASGHVEDYGFVLTAGSHQFQVLEIPPVGLPRETTIGFEIDPGQVQDLDVVVNNVPVTIDPLQPPTIQQIGVQFENDEPELVIEGDFLISQNPGAPQINSQLLGSQVSHLTVNFYVGEENAPRWTETPLPTSTPNLLRVSIPAEAIIGLTRISLSRDQHVRESFHTWKRMLVEGAKSRPATTMAPYAFSALPLDEKIAVINATNRQMAARIPLGVGRPGPQPNSAPRSVIVTNDDSRAYVSLFHAGGISVVDTVSLREVDVEPDINGQPETTGINHISLPMEQRRFVWLYRQTTVASM